MNRRTRLRCEIALLCALATLVAGCGHRVIHKHESISPDGHFRCTVEQTATFGQGHYIAVITVTAFTNEGWHVVSVNRIDQDSMGKEYYSITWTYDETNRWNNLVIWGGNRAMDSKEVVFRNKLQ